MRSTNSQVALLGIRIDDVSLDEAVSIIDSMIDSGGCHQVATANVDFLSKAVGDRDLMEILNSCELVLPDGMPLVWASRLMGASLKERVTGADLFRAFWSFPSARSAASSCWEQRKSDLVAPWSASSGSIRMLRSAGGWRRRSHLLTRWQMVRC